MREMILRTRQNGKKTEMEKELKRMCKNKRQYKKALKKIKIYGCVTLYKGKVMTKYLGKMEKGGIDEEKYHQNWRDWKMLLLTEKKDVK